MSCTALSPLPSAGVRVPKILPRTGTTYVLCAVLHAALRCGVNKPRRGYERLKRSPVGDQKKKKKRRKQVGKVVLTAGDWLNILSDSRIKMIKCHRLVLRAICRSGGVQSPPIGVCDPLILH